MNTGAKDDNLPISYKIAFLFLCVITVASLHASELCINCSDTSLSKIKISKIYLSESETWELIDINSQDTAYNICFLLDVFGCPATVNIGAISLMGDSADITVDNLLGYDTPLEGNWHYGFVYVGGTEISSCKMTYNPFRCIQINYTNVMGSFETHGVYLYKTLDTPIDLSKYHSIEFTHISTIYASIANNHSQSKSTDTRINYYRLDGTPADFTKGMPAGILLKYDHSQITKTINLGR